jgi:hypothetical protein
MLTPHTKQYAYPTERFDAKGAVLNGPANADLQEVDDQAVEKAWLPGKAAPDQG